MSDKIAAEGSMSFPTPPSRSSVAWGGAFGVPPYPEQEPPMLNYRAHSLRQPFNLIARMATKKPLLGVSVGLPSCDFVRLMAGVGYDFVFMDWEHTSFSIREITEMIKTINATSEGHTAVVVRVPGNHHEYIAWVLDAGASGIVVPHVESAEQARAIVKAARFHKANHGDRSFPPFAIYPGINDGTPEGTTIFDSFNNAAVIMQIESKRGVDNVEEIAAVPGVNGLMIGTVDLAFDLGITFAAMRGNPIIGECVAKVMGAARKHGLATMGLSFHFSLVKSKIEEGYTMVTVDNDVWVVAQTFRSHLVSARAAVQELTESQNEEASPDGQ